jgi:hypothetical protein
MKTQTMIVTPDLAKAWLSKNSHNRPIRPARVKQYAQDIQNGQWQVTHQGIAFYDDGSLADGQHRLKAVELANLPVQMMVTTGLKKYAAAAIDAGKPREFADTMHIVNKETWVTKEIVAIARVALNDFNKNGYSLSGYDIQEYLHRYKDWLILTSSLVPTKRKRLTTSLVQIAYFCALYAGEPTAKIARFAKIILSGEIAGPHENAAIRVREMLLAGKYDKEELVRRIQQGIKNFCNNMQTKRLNDPGLMLYNLPE